MEIALSAFLCEIAQQSISFLIGKLSKEASFSLPPDENLHRRLLRVRIIVEEAEGRQIRNQAMLEQLKVLQAGMYRGYYALDAFKYRPYKEDTGKDGNLTHHSFAISSLKNPAKRFRLCGRSSQQGGEKELHQVLGSLDITITDASEFVMFLKSCPPLHRRLRSAYLILEKCMFARHVEVERIISFLMQKRSPAGSIEDEDCDVLPIVGPPKSGKSTLIEHVCNDERVRSAFSRIVFFAEDDLDERTNSVRCNGGTVKYQSHASGRGKCVLVIVEVKADINEPAWSSLYSASKRCATNGAKIIICSRSEKSARFGTTRALKVEDLTQDAYWYFFKNLAFGSMDPEHEPRLASIAMEIAAGLNGSFIAANVIARMLRENLSAKFWNMALSCFKKVNQRYHFTFGAHPVGPSQDRKLLSILNGTNEYCSIFDGYQTVSARDEAPRITIQEILLGSVVPRGKSDVLAWRSSIPPYYSYTLSCEIHEA